MNQLKQKRENLFNMAVLAIFIAIEILFCFTVLGSIPLGPIVATTAHLPALVAAILLGYKGAAVIGSTMGICSLLYWTFIGVASPVAFAFTPAAPYGNFMSAVIAILPRALFPLLCTFLYRFFMNKKWKPALAATVAGTVATAVHSVSVVGLIYITFSGNSDVSASLGDNFITMITAWCGVNALAEIGVAALVCGTVAATLLRYFPHAVNHKDSL